MCLTALNPPGGDASPRIIEVYSPLDIGVAAVHDPTALVFCCLFFPHCILADESLLLP